MNAVGEMCLLPRIDEADYSAFRAILADENSGKKLPPSYDEWLKVIAMRRREGRSCGNLVREVPINIVQFSAFCGRTGIDRPTMHTLDRFITELARP